MTKELPAHLSRRNFLAAAGASGVLLATGYTPAATAAPITRNPLRLLSSVSPSGPYTLDMRPGRVDLGGGSLCNAWVYNGSLPGPLFRARTGDLAQVGLTNNVSAESITHWHGMIVDHANDGHPIQAIPPGGRYDYSFRVQQRAALNWYHPHPHMMTGHQVATGLAGGFIVNDAEEDALGLPGGAYEMPLIVRDASVDSAGNLQYTARGGGFLGDFALVNGTRDPYVNVDTAVYRLRVLNGSNARIFGLTLNNGAGFTLIGNDGGLLSTSTPLTRLDIAPGERLDVLVDLRGLPVGSTVMLHDARARWDLLEFRVTRQVSIPYTLPTALSTIPALTNPVRTRVFSFDGMSKINNREYDVNRIDFQVPFGEVELWRFVTSGNAPHPVHVHGASFQVVSRSGGRNRLFPWEAGWKDTVLLEDRETVEILVRFDAFCGTYVMHCHKLEHEDMGMMTNFQVV